MARGRSPCQPKGHRGAMLASVPTADICALVLDCADDAAMRRMYLALGAVPDGRYPGSDALVLSGLTLCFQVVEHHRQSTWPGSQVPAQLHIDLLVDSPVEMQRHLEGFGASKAQFQPHRDNGIITMLAGRSPVLHLHQAVAGPCSGCSGSTPATHYPGRRVAAPPPGRSGQRVRVRPRRPPRSARRTRHPERSPRPASPRRCRRARPGC